MTDLYGEQHRKLQNDFGTAALADRVHDIIVAAEIADDRKAFIESRDMFFLTTIDHRGYPTCSYKGGAPGFVKVINATTLIFPSYDGNGMYLSMGNISSNPKIGLLFIDFETPHRIRVHGDARLETNSALLSQYPGAEAVISVAISEIFINCPRYIHRHQRLESSKYIPQADCAAPLAQWKRIDAVQDVIPERDQFRVAEAGGLISPEAYGELLMKGEA